MKMTADQLLKIAGIAPTTTLRARLNESAGGSRRTRRTVKESMNKYPKSFPTGEYFMDWVYDMWPFNGETHVEHQGGGHWSAEIGGNSPIKFATYDERTKQVTWLDANHEEISESAGLRTRRSVKESTAKDQLAARELIASIESPSVDQQMAAVKVDPDAIEYIDEPAIEVQEYVVRRRPDLIVHIHNPSEEIQMLAVENGEDALENIKKPTRAVRKLHAEIWG